MLIEVIAYTIYYAISIYSIYISWYFRRFTIPDYQYNKKLRVKRRWIITLDYFAAFLQATIIGTGNLVFIFPVYKNPWIGWSAIVFLIAYIFVLDWVESPRAWRKRKK